MSIWVRPFGGGLPSEPMGRRLLVAVAVWGALSTTTIASAGPVGPAIALEPARAAVGEMVDVVGSGHPDVCAAAPLQLVVQIDAVDVAAVGAISGGAFETEVTVPDRPPGVAVVETVCRVVGVLGVDVALPLASAELEVLEAPPNPSGGLPPPEGTTFAAAGPNGDSGATDPLPSVGSAAGEVAQPASGPAGSGATGGARDPGVAPGPSAPASVATVLPDTERPSAGSPEDPKRPGAAVASWVNDSLTLERLPGRVVDTAVLAGLFVVLVGFPASLFDSTVRSHYDDLVARATGGRSWVDRARTTLARLPDRLALAGAATVGSVVTLAIDPGVAFDRDTFWFALGLAIAFGLLGGIGWLPAKRWAVARGVPGRWRAYPTALVIVVACVAVSRGLGIAPGYLYGLLFAFHVAGAMSAFDDAFTYLRGFQVVLVMACIAWIVWIVAGPFGDGAWGIVADTVVTTLVAGGIQGTLFALAPWTGTPGGRVRAEFPRAWTALAVASVACFVLLLVDPGADLFDVASGSTLVLSVVAFTAFCAVSFGTWWRLTLRPRRAVASVA